jgi:toluene monooxygenase system ferredoxin subunit
MWKQVCQRDDVPMNGMKQFDVEGHPPILIVNAGADYFAYQADCPHQAVPLEDGIHDGAVLTCLEHLWQFDLRSGAPLGDAETALEAYRLKEEDGTLYVWVDSTA